MTEKDASLDAAFSVNSLVMNGGLDHAFEVAGDQFHEAIQGFQLAGRLDIAALLRAFLDVTGSQRVPDSMEARTALLMRLDENSMQKIQDLVDAYDQLSDPREDIERVE